MLDIIPDIILWPISGADQLLRIFLPPAASVALWAIFSSSISMALYARLAPQATLSALKQRQKATRQQLLAYDGAWEGAWKLMRENLSVSFRLIGLCLVPVMAATLPVAWIMYGLYQCYPQQVRIIPFGPVWMQGFDMYYLLVLLVISLFIKVRFRII